MIYGLSARLLVMTLVIGGQGLWPSAAPAQDLRFFRIVTGSAVSTYFPVGMDLAWAISSPTGSRPCDKGGPCGVPGLVAVAATSQGSLANVNAVASGIADSALANADVVYAAHGGDVADSRGAKLADLRVIANLYPQTVHLVARRGAGIKAVRDLVGKRVSLDKPGSGTRRNAETILAAYSLRIGQLKIFEVDPGEAVDLMVNNELDAMFLVAGFPAPTVTELAQKEIAELVPIGGRAADAAVRRHRFFALDSIPPDTYPGMNGDVATLSVGTQWVVSARADPELIYQITAALWHPRSRMFLDSGHAKSKLIRLDTALTGIAIPLHPGAERYYREVGALP
jgi:TRAP transporter TAXI family solute receptor